MLISALALGTALTACGGSTSPPPAGEIVVKAPDFTLQGCTYVLDGTVPAGEPTGVQPHFATFSPDASATSALQSIKKSGGVALASGFMIPGGTPLYAGPDTSGPKVGTIPSNYAVLVAEPVIWGAGTDDQWAAFFISCGGSNLYWLSLKQLEHQNPQAASSVTPLITKSSLVPIAIQDRQFAWVHSPLTFIIGRGEMFGPVA